MPIKLLAPEVANQIAAGEVVERPSSAVKELIENSLDAGATDIRVEVREGGRRLIRVQDDGGGIAAVETELLFHRHATSKIDSAADLDHLTTLGFRGEALASIGSVAQVTLLTSARGESVGTLLRVGGGQELSRETRGAPPGATITVEHLFANVPARLKFLKQPATEAGHILQIVTRYALAYPERRFSLVSDGRLVFQSSGSGKLYDVLVKVYGLEMARQMVEMVPPGGTRDWRVEIGDSDAQSPISTLQSPIRVTGYTGVPSLHRANRSYISLFVNRRWFQDNSLAYAVIQAYHTLLPVGRYPVALIFIEMDPGEVDVNVHPTKAEVRFRNSNAVFSAVQRAVRQTLIEHAPIPGINLDEVTSDASTPGGQEAGEVAWRQGHVQLSWDDAAAQADASAQADAAAWDARRHALLNAGRGERQSWEPEAGWNAAQGAPPQAGYGAGQDAMEAGAGPASGVGSGSGPGAGSRLMPLLRVVGQVAATYIIAEGPDGMYLIDQHAAHERVLFEQMLAAQAGQGIPVQPLLAPVVLDLEPEAAAIVAEELDGLRAVGLELEPFGGGSYLLRSVPAILTGQDPQGAVAEIVDGLLNQSDAVAGAHEAVLVTLICKRAAVKGGHVLAMPEMQELVRRLEACRSPRTCPHGRPTMIHVSAAELAKQFGRT